MKVKTVIVFEFDDLGEDSCENCPIADLANLDMGVCPYVPELDTDEFERWFGENKRSQACKDSVKILKEGLEK